MPVEPNIPHPPWWRGSRGEWYVAAQGCLFLLMVLGPANWPGLPEWQPPYTWLGSLAGGLSITLGALLSLAGVFQLGTNLTPLPYPKEGATLIETGPYRLVRHPIYSGLIFMAFGWGLWSHSWLRLGFAILIFIFFDIKSCREERWLRERFPDYAAYQKRTRKLIPFLH